MTPAEIREAVARLVEAGQGASRGEWRVVPKRYEVESVEGMVAGGIGRGDGNFIVEAANARPALAAIAGKVWLDVEDAKLAESALLSMGARWEFDPEGALPIAAKAAYEAADRLAREVAALAAAEAEVARVEGLTP